jgi:glycerol-3-phosphate acyltransferase PlsX
MRIAVDAMGGDHAPREIVAGTVQAAREFTDVQFILVGDKDAVEREISVSQGVGLSNISVQHSPQVVGMGDHPTEALRGKRNSSVTMSTSLVARGEAQAVISAGNTGAAVACATVLLKPLPGIKRSGIAVSFPTHYGPVVAIDVGANIHCKPIHLLQYALMASVVSEHLLGVRNPRVGLLNIGSEDEKGNELVKETRRLLGEHPRLNFVGNIEGYDIHRGKCDVVVCEGFVGNVILKVAEGLSSSLLQDVQSELEQAFPGRRNEYADALRKLRIRNDYAEYGGAPLLGVDGICIIAHGTSNARAIYNALRVARGFEGKQVNERIAEAVAVQLPQDMGKGS